MAQQTPEQQLTQFKSNCKALLQECADDSVALSAAVDKVLGWVSWVGTEAATPAHVDHFNRQFLPAAGEHLPLHERFESTSGPRWARLRSVARGILCAQGQVLARTWLRGPSAQPARAL